MFLPISSTPQPERRQTPQRRHSIEKETPTNVRLFQPPCKKSSKSLVSQTSFHHWWNFKVLVLGYSHFMILLLYYPSKKNIFLKIIFWAFQAFIIEQLKTDRKWHTAKGQGWNWTPGHCGWDSAFIHGECKNVYLNINTFYPLLFNHNTSFAN